MGSQGSGDAVRVVEVIPMLRRLVVGELTVGGRRGRVSARAGEKEEREARMTGGSRVSEREGRARAGRLGRPRWWAEWAACGRNRPGREREKEKGSP
jgi:hypothetical protein